MTNNKRKGPRFNAYISMNTKHSYIRINKYLKITMFNVKEHSGKIDEKLMKFTQVLDSPKEKKE